ncbi:hypothetical protein [Yoonia sp. MH D7]
MQRPSPAQHFNDDAEFYSRNTTCDPFEVLHSSSTAEGMPVEWTFDRAVMSAKHQQSEARS